MSELLEAPLVLREHTGDRVVASFAIGAEEPVFAGHYPDFPILPGVLLFDCVHRVVRETAPGPVELSAVDSCRFTGAVYPGDTVTVTLQWKGEQVSATVHSGQQQAAKMKLSYRGVS
ncbi:3-hydroxyacyl-ACP dehydratase FabZ family protein [Sciscionella marina]|uniref:3-hydroxyacyl-ACP dehydratase FabZ family protein n=1 Tax=Sciscionella marina TaxID=508770 RepID=UPI00037186FC|nr:MaoC/PaaZ C-terminal domain-containing protein [Sciscionella marina]